MASIPDCVPPRISLWSGAVLLNDSTRRRCGSSLPRPPPNGGPAFGTDAQSESSNTAGYRAISARMCVHLNERSATPMKTTTWITYAGACVTLLGALALSPAPVSASMQCSSDWPACPTPAGVCPEDIIAFCASYYYSCPPPESAFCVGGFPWPACSGGVTVVCMYPG